MRNIFNLKSGLLFLLTTGLPILGLVGGIAIEVFVIEQNSGAGYYSSDLGSNLFIGSWMLGFLIFHLWALVAGISLVKDRSVLKVNKWATLTFGLLSLLVLLYTSLESLFLLLNIIPATESSGGLSAIQTTTDAIIAFSLIFGVWFLPRMLFFSFLAILLCHREGNNRWISDRAVTDHLIDQ